MQLVLLMVHFTWMHFSDEVCEKSKWDRKHLFFTLWRGLWYWVWVFFSKGFLKVPVKKCGNILRNVKKILLLFRDIQIFYSTRARSDTLRANETLFPLFDFIEVFRVIANLVGCFCICVGGCGWRIINKLMFLWGWEWCWVSFYSVSDGRNDYHVHKNIVHVQAHNHFIGENIWLSTLFIDIFMIITFTIFQFWIIRIFCQYRRTERQLHQINQTMHNFLSKSINSSPVDWLFIND